MLKKCFALTLMAIFPLCCSDIKDVNIKIVNNPGFPINITLTGTDKASHISIIAPRDRLEDTILEIATGKEQSKTKKLKELNAKLNEDIKTVLSTIESDPRAVINLSKFSDIEYKQQYDQLANIFQRLIYGHWTVLPSSPTIHTGELKLQYPIDTAARDLKRIIYTTINSIENDTVPKHSMYNILIYKNNQILKNTVLIPDIDDIISMNPEAHGSFKLELTASKLEYIIFHDRSTLFTFYHPPCLSIGDSPVKDFFQLKLVPKNEKSIALYVSTNANETIEKTKSATIANINFIQEFDSYIDSTSGTTITGNNIAHDNEKKVYEFFKKSLGAVAYFMAKNITLQTEEIRKINVSTALSWTIARPTTFNMYISHDIVLEYPAGTTVGQLKNIIYEKLSNKAILDDDKDNYDILKNKYYNIVIYNNGVIMPDNALMPNVDFVSQQPGNQFMLQLSKKKKIEQELKNDSTPDTSTKTQSNQSTNRFQNLYNRLTSFFSGDWFQKRKAAVLTFLGIGAGALTIGAINKYGSPNWFQSWFKPAPQSKPTVVPQN